MMRHRSGPARLTAYLLAFSVFLLAYALLACPSAEAATRTVRIGVYANEPKEFIDSAGQPSGVFVDLIQEIAKNEDWDLVWVEGTFSEGLSALEADQLDLMPDVAFTEDRAKLYDFHKTAVVESWSYVYAAPGQRFDRLSQLQGKRVAVLKGSIQETVFAQMVSGFGLDVTLVSMDSFEAAFDAAQNGTADATIANHFFGDHFYVAHGLTKTPIVFNPSPLYYVTAKGRNPELLEAIDRNLDAWKQQPDSPYYGTLTRYTTGEAPPREIPGYLIVTAWLTVGLLVLSTVLVLMLRWRVGVETRHLVEAQMELRTALERLKYHVENSPLASVQFDSELRVSQWSGNAERLFGWTADEVLGHRLDELHWVYQPDAPDVEAMMAGMIEGRELSNVHTNRNYRKDGTIVVCEWYNSGLTDEADHLVSIQALALDITQREEAAEAIERQSAALAGLLEVSAALAATVDLDVVLDVIVQSALCLSGQLDTGLLYLLEDDRLRLGTTVPPLEDPPETLVHPQLDDEVRLRQCLSTGQPVVVEDAVAADLTPTERLTSDVWSAQTLVYLPLLTGDRSVGSLVLGSTTRRTFSAEEIDLYRTLCGQAALAIENAQLFEQTSQHARTLELRVAERTAELSVALEKSKELDRLKSMFIATMSHELRTPLNSIIGFSSVMLSEWAGPLNDEQKENVSIVMRAGKHLLKLINDVIDVSKIEAGKVEITIEDFDLADVVGEVVEMVEPQALEHGLAFSAEPINFPMHSERRRVLQALLNLTSNAIKFTEQGGVSITSKTTDDGAFVEVAVADTGIGIPEDMREQLFGAFVRLDSPLKSKVAGTGLGLHLTRILARDILHGDITYAENPGGGSIFTLRIPVRIGG